MCSICEQVKPLVESAAAQTGAKLIEYNVADTSWDKESPKQMALQEPRR